MSVHNDANRCAHSFLNSIFIVDTLVYPCRITIDCLAERSLYPAYSLISFLPIEIFELFTMPAANKSQAKSSSAAVGPKSASASQTPSACLQALVEERMTSLIRDAASIQRHAKRARLHPVPGGGAVVKRRLHASDVNMALRLRDSEPLYGTGVSVTSNADDVILELADYVRQPVVTQPPSEVAASMHWLAVQGQVPDIPQNVSTGSTGTATSSSPTKVSTSATTAVGLEGVRAQRHPPVLPKCLHLLPLRQLRKRIILCRCSNSKWPCYRKNCSCIMPT